MSEKLWPRDGGYFLFSCSCPRGEKYFVSFAWPHLHHHVPSPGFPLCAEPFNQRVQQIFIVSRPPGAERCARNWGPEVQSIFVQIKMDDFSSNSPPPPPPTTLSSEDLQKLASSHRLCHHHPGTSHHAPCLHPSHGLVPLLSYP